MVSWTRLWTFLATLMGVPSPCNSHALWTQIIGSRIPRMLMGILPPLPFISSFWARNVQDLPICTIKTLTKKSMTSPVQVEEGAKFGPNHYQISLQSNSHLKSLNQTTLKVFQFLQWRIYLNFYSYFRQPSPNGLKSSWTVCTYDKVWM